MRKENKAIAGIWLLLLAAAFAAYWFLHQKPVIEVPPPVPPPVVIPEDAVFTSPVAESTVDYFSSTTPSKISIKVELPFEQLKRQAEQSTPKIFEGSGQGPDQCTTVLGIKKCVGTQFQYRVARSDIAMLAGANNDIQISIPLTITGSGGLRGKVAEWFHLDAKQFRAKVAAHANIGLALDSNWCPKLKITPSFRWLESAEVEIISKVWVDISDVVEKEVRTQVRQMGKEFARAIRCDDVRQEIKRFWVSRSLAVQTASNVGYINLFPMKLGFSGFQIKPESVNLYLMLTVKADMAGHPVKGPRLEPPQMSLEKFKPGAIHLNVPFYYAYATLQRELSKRLVGTEFFTELSAGSASAMFRQLEIYPANQKLVFAGLVNARLPGVADDFNGWVYWEATPGISEEGGVIRLQSLTLTAPFDERAWRRIALVVEKTLSPALSPRGVLELDIPAMTRSNAITASLEKLQHGAMVNIARPATQIVRVFPLASALYVEGVYRSGADLDYTVTQ